VFDAVASILIGVLLAIVAVLLGSDTRGLLLGEAALPRDRQKIRAIIAGHDGVADVIQVLTMATGPTSLLVAARVHLRSDLHARDIEEIAHAIDKRLREECPAVEQVFLDPTSRRELGPAAKPARDPSNTSHDAGEPTYQPAR
jgi:divalent metal cation (Fe/Co/Zn/Cd) transporter